MQCEVLRPFQAIDRVLDIGEQVETAPWRPAAVQSLIERRYLKPLAIEQAPAEQPAGTKEKRHG